MITKETVLVLGAGASMPYGFPSGRKLKDDICDHLYSLQSLQSTEVHILRELGFGDEHIKDFRKALSLSARPSVDMFLERRGDFLDVGKAAIALELIKYEMTKTLFDDWRKIRGSDAVQFLGWREKRGNDWYEHLFNELTGDISLAEFSSNKLSVITFNYDRSLEHYLITALSEAYGETQERCAAELQKMPIVHVHGSLGTLPWQYPTNDEVCVPYESWPIRNEQGICRIKKAAKSIKIVHEATDADQDFVRAHEFLMAAERIFFLGFGYHATNLANLHLQQVSATVIIYGTGKGLARSRASAAYRETQGKLSDGSAVGTLKSMDVYELLHDHAPLE